MDFASYQKAYYLDPAPQSRYHFKGSFGITLYFEDFTEAIAFYEQVLGPAGYQEGEDTRGWAIGHGWLTFLKGNSGNPRNVEIGFEMETVQEAEALQRAFIAAGAKGPAPSDQLMYVPVHSCPVSDPFGVDVMIFAALAKS